MIEAGMINAFADLMPVHAEQKAEHASLDHEMLGARRDAAEFDEGRSGLDGFDNIVACVNNPMDNTLTTDGEKLFKIIGHLHTFVDESIERSAELLTSIELGEERVKLNATKMREAMTYINDVHERRLELNAEYDALSKADSVAQRAMLRSVMSEIEDANELSDVMSEKFKDHKLAGKQAQITLDTDRFELDGLRKMRIKEVFNAKALLFSDPKWKGIPSAEIRLSPSDRKTMKLAFEKPLLLKLEAFDGTGKGTNTTMLGVVSTPVSVFTETIAQDMVRFKQSEIAKKVGNIYTLIKSLTKGDHTRVGYDDVILTRSPEIAEENALLNEIYFLNLTAMAGYDPTSWAQAFGVPISGIGKRILSEWDHGRMGPLTSERLIKLFEHKSYATTLSLNYEELDLKFMKDDIKIASDAKKEIQGKDKGGREESFARLVAEFIRNPPMEDGRDGDEEPVE
uniref:Uncharacterized protein n=1 Tax=viral metagenome TaxID=1070528 RepID=A0A2V0RMP0_9ZZZZ